MQKNMPKNNISTIATAAAVVVVAAMLTAEKLRRCSLQFTIRWVRRQLLLQLQLLCWSWTHVEPGVDLTVQQQQVQQHDKETTLQQRSHCISFDCLCIIFGDLGKTPSPSSSRSYGPASVAASAPTRPLNFRRRNGFLFCAQLSLFFGDEEQEDEEEMETMERKLCTQKVILC